MRRLGRQWPRLCVVTPRHGLEGNTNMVRYAGWLGCLALVVLVIGCNEPAPPEGGGGTAAPSQAAPPTSKADDAPKAPPAPTPKKPAADETPKPPVAKTPKTPEINATYWINTHPLTLAGLRGKTVLLEFWATWCPPCRTTIPHLIELHKQYAPKGLVIVSLTNEPKETVEPFAKQMGMIYALGGGSMSGRDYRVRGIPHAFLIDPSGSVVWRGHPLSPGLNEALRKQLEQKAK